MSQNIRKLSRKLEDVFTKLIGDVPSFEVLNKDVLPYGLKQHTRSICWLAEQVILQNVKKRQVGYGIAEYQRPGFRCFHLGCMSEFHWTHGFAMLNKHKGFRCDPACQEKRHSLGAKVDEILRSASISTAILCCINARISRKRNLFPEAAYCQILSVDWRFCR